MNATEGLVRIAMVVRWVGYLVGMLWALLAIATAAKGGLYFLILTALFAGGGWVVGWIIEGFAKPKAP